MNQRAVESCPEVVVDLSEKKPIRVLHVDDEPALQKVAKQCLELQGPFQVDTAGSVEEALAKLEKEQYDAVVSDYQMPEKDGLQFLKELRAKGNSIPFIVFTGKGREEVAIKALNLGADGYFNKSGYPETVYGELAHGIRQVADKRRAEQSLLKSEDKYRRLVETLREGIWVIDKDSCTTFANPRMAEILGYNIEEMKGRHLFSFMDERGVEIAKRLLERRRQGIKEQHTFEFLRKDGTRIYTTLETSPITDDNGNYNGALASVMDITELKKTEKELQSERKRLLQVLETLPEMVCLLTPDYHVAFANRSFREKFGESKGRHCYDQCFGKSKPCDFCESYEVLKTGKPHHWEVTTPDGSIIDAYDFPFTDTDGTPMILELDFDITERKRSEELLRESEEKSRGLFESIQDPVGIFVGREGRLIDYNAAFKKSSGYADEELKGKVFLDFVHPDDCAMVLEKYQTKYSEKEFPLVYEIRGMNKKGECVPLELSVSTYKKKGKVIGIEVIHKDITERKKAEEELKKSEEKYRRIFESANDVILYVDKMGGIIDINETAKDVFGYDRTELIGKNVFTSEFIDLSQLPKMIGVFKSSVDKNEVLDTTGERINRMEVEIKHKKGHIVLVEASTEVIEEDGNATGFLSVLRDITERKKAEEAVRLSEEKYKGLFENARDVIVLFDLKGNVTSINKMAEEEYGFKNSEVLGKSMLKFVSKRYWPKLLSDVAKVALGKTAEGRIEIHTPKGDRMAEYRSNPILSGSRVVGIQAILEDITEREVMEETIRESEEKWRSLVDMAPDGILTADLKGMITSANNAFLKLTGYTREEVVGKHFTKLHTIPVKDIPRYAKLMIPALGGKLPPRFEYSYKRKDGRVGWAEARVGVLTKDGKTIGFQAFLRETTERRQAEQAMRKAKEFSESLIDSMQDGLSVLDIHGVHVSVNPALCKMTGFSKEELIGVGPPHPYWPPEARKDIERAFQMTLRGEFGDFELTFMRKNGERFPVIVTPSVIRDEHGNSISYFATIKDVTFLKKAESELKKREAELSAIIENTGDSVWSIDNKGRLLFANTTFKRLFSLAYGVELKEGVNLKEMVPRAQIPFWVETHNRALKGGHISLEQKLEIKGVSVDVEISVNPILNENGEPVGANYFSRDITERKKAEEALKDSEDKFRNLAEQSPNMIFINQKGRVVYANRKAEDVMGYTKEEFCSPDFNFLDLIAEESKELVKSSFSKHTRGDDVAPYEYELITREGRTIDAIINPKLIRYGGESAILGVVTDITDRKKAERMTLASQQDFKALFMGNPEAAAHLALDFHILDVNPRFEELFGYSLAEAKGRHINDVIVPETRMEEAETLDKNAIEGYVYHSTVRKRKDGSLVPVAVSAATMMVEGKPAGCVAMYKDISELKNAEKKLETMNEKLRVVGGLTRHDVRNKLSTVTGNAFLLEKQLAGDRNVVDKLRDMEAAVSQVTRIFDFAKDYEMLGIEELTYLDVQKSVNEAVQLFSDLGEVRVLNECDGLKVLSDSLLRQLFYNLIDNSLKHGEKLSQIRIHYEKAEGNQLRLVYEDNGAGISQEVKPKLFDEGFTTGKGSGYGLYLIKRMMEVYGWTISETGAPGRGARFTMVIPEKNHNGKENYKLH